MAIIKYGCSWDVNDHLAVELAAIRQGGKWKGASGREYGEGLFHHYREAQKLCWPNQDHHRWSDLALSNILGHRMCGLMGPGSSNKTFSASKYALIDYWAFPHNTLILVSSTDVRGLELRVWGKIKEMFNEATERFPWLDGNPIDYLKCITTDEIEEGRARSLTKGIICIPCLTTAGHGGLSKYLGVKAQRLRLISDECFPADTMVDTPSGKYEIQRLVPGDKVFCASGVGVITKIIKTPTPHQLVKIRTKDSRVIRCTPDHPFLTQFGWVKAIDIDRSHYMVSQYEAMRILHESNLQGSFLRSILYREMDYESAQIPNSSLYKITQSKNRSEQNRDVSKTARASKAIQRANEERKPNVQTRYFKTGEPKTSGYGLEAPNSWRKREGNDKTRKGFTFIGSAWNRSLELCHCYQNEIARVSNQLQSGCCNTIEETCHRSGRPNSQQSEAASDRRKEDNGASGSWVDRVEIFKPGHSGEFASGSGDNYVYNLSVRGHPSYSVNGFLVHNCQMMGASFLDATANLQKNPDWKFVPIGNPTEQEDPLGLACEPLEGWTAMPEPTKTTVWKTKFLDGVCVNFVGTDSPNFDYPDEKAHFNYLPSHQSIKEIEMFWGKDSWHFSSQAVGVMRTGLQARRVITRDLCKEHHAQEKAYWGGNDLQSTKLTRVYAIDAAYGGQGGDRCVAGYVEFGVGMDGYSILRVNPPVIVPVSVKRQQLPEDQIAEFVLAETQNFGVPPENIFYDSTGRGTLGSGFARVFGTHPPIPIEFGGRPDKRPVRFDLYIGEGREKRLKLCDEHYLDKVSQLWFTARYVIEADQMRELPDEVMKEGCSREFGVAGGNKLFVESKHDPKARERMKRSPDLFDWLVTAIEGAIQRGFKVSRLGVDFTELTGRSALDDIVKQHTDLWRKKQLSYR